jgi:hypothetical protein
MGERRIEKGRSIKTSLLSPAAIIALLFLIPNIAFCCFVRESPRQLRRESESKLGRFRPFFTASTSTLVGLGLLGYLVRDGIKASGEAVSNALVKSAPLVGKEAISGGGTYFSFGVLSGAIATALTSLKGGRIQK